MNSDNLNFRWIIFLGLVSLLFIGTYTYLQTLNSYTTVVFCDVGQGDGAYIRIKNRFDVVIDAGPDRKILGCLGRYMPFYDHEIELAIMSHPQKDHIYGFIPILDRYKIDRFVMPPLRDPSKTFSTLIDKIYKKNIPIYFAHAQNIITLGDASLNFYWPTQDFLNSHLVYDKPNENFAPSSLDDNYFSHLLQFKQADLKILFTGDLPPQVLNKFFSQFYLKSTILKVPHHGSKNGLTKGFLGLVDPKVAVISVGQKNSYGHPSAEILDMLKASKVKIRRTDKEGDIVFKIQNSKL